MMTLEVMPWELYEAVDETLDVMGDTPMNTADIRLTTLLRAFSENYPEKVHWVCP